MLYVETDPEGQIRATAFRQALEKLGWTVGRNLHIHYLWGIGDGEWTKAAAAELVRLSPDAVLANGGAAVRAVQQVTSTLPTVFIGTADPVADGIVRGLAQPGGNLTGFTVLQPSMGAKLLELLKEIAPGVTRVGVIMNDANTGSRQIFDNVNANAHRFGVDVIILPGRASADIEAIATRLGGETSHGLLVPPDPVTNTYRHLIVKMAALYRLPAVYALRTATLEGGLLSYGVDIPELFRQSASYVDRILRGEAPGDLPVQQPTKFELVINLKCPPRRRRPWTAGHSAGAPARLPAHSRSALR
jgi:putative tryptophan/tyrosine transport system substrate-binding protein